MNQKYFSLFCLQSFFSWVGLILMYVKDFSSLTFSFSKVWRARRELEDTRDEGEGEYYWYLLLAPSSGAQGVTMSVRPSSISQCHTSSHRRSLKYFVLLMSLFIKGGAVLCPQHLLRLTVSVDKGVMLDSDWLTRITWPECWTLIGWDGSRDLNAGFWLVEYCKRKVLCSHPGTPSHLSPSFPQKLSNNNQYTGVVTYKER